MSIYLGQIGRMVELKCPSSQQLSMGGEPTFEDTLEGMRIPQVSPFIGRRTWQNQLSDASTPQEVSAVMSFVNREWGVGPFVFVSADAPVVNLLTPAQSSCDLAAGTATVNGNFFTGPMQTPDGWAGRSIGNESPEKLLYFGAEFIPALPGQAVTASAYVQGTGAAVRVYFYDASSAIVGSAVTGGAGTAGEVIRSVVTALPPAGAVSCRIFAINAVAACRPAMTWTDQALPWADGQGCMKAIIHGASRDLVMASRDPRGGRYSNLSFTVSEVW